MKLRILLFSILMCAFFIPCFAQEENADFAEDTQYPENISSEYSAEYRAEYRPGSVFVINSFVFNIKGITRNFALVKAAGFIAGEEITGLSNLEKFINDKTQLLINERVLKDNVRIDHTIGSAREDGKYPVDLVIYVEDTWNLIAIPRPQYDSNSGWDITLKARDYNFFGTMTPLRFDVGYQYDNEGRNFVNFMLDSGIPFEFLGLEWDFNFDHYFNYRPDMGQPFYYRNVTGLSVGIPLWSTSITIGFQETLVYNDENSEKEKYGDFQEGIYMNSNPYISWGIPLGIEAGEYGGISYSVNFSANFPHEIPVWPLAEYRKWPSLSFGHSIGFGRIDWIGNFLSGFSAGMDNSFGYSFFNESVGGNPLSISYSITGRGHFIITDYFGVSARIKYSQWFNSDNSSAGGSIRGVMDGDIYADYMLFLNLDLVLKVFMFRPSEWFKNEKLNILDIDFHAAPIIDIAFSHDPRTGSLQGFNNLNVAAGLEIIVFPLFFRSLFLRVSAATDVYRMLLTKERGPIEIFIGTELHY